MNSPVQLHVCVDNVASFYQQAVNQGALVVYPPEVKPWNERTCKLKCPDGHDFCGDVFPGQFLFQLPSVLLSQQSGNRQLPLSLSLWQDVAPHRLQKGDLILTIDGLPVTNGKVSYFGVTMPVHQYAHTQLSGHQFPITVRRNGKLHETHLTSYPLNREANHSRYLSSFLPAPCLTVILSGCMLTEHFVNSSRVDLNSEPGFVSESERRLIQLSWVCALQGAEGETALERTLPIELLGLKNWFVRSINGVLIKTFTDVFSTVKQSNLHS